ncbi:MAG: hypothetical protein HY659_05090 [Rhizobiales bacterium]|nr:hypothetical protein [Hyphomicrobiales bacterium]
MSSHRSARQPHFALLLGFVWLFVVAQLLAQHWSATGQSLGDSDDAMRLVEVRAFLAGQGWFDLHESRVQPPMGYDSHWSRLIDAGLVSVFLIIRSIASTTFAEHLMRVIWPLLWLVPAIAATAAMAWRLAGRQAALAALLLIATGLPAFQQFTPGRIDHHNVQITLALLTLAAALWADRVQWTAWTAGALSGLALAIGLESLPFIALAGGIFVVRYVLNRAAAMALTAYGLAIAVSAIIAFIVSINPEHWTRSACDAIAINSVGALVVGGLALAAAGHWVNTETMLMRGIAVATAAALAAAVFILMETRCLAGPFAMIDPATRPIWLAHVREMQPFIVLAQKFPAAGAAVAAFPVSALVCAAMLARESNLRGDTGFIFTAMALVLAVGMTLAAVRASHYAIWLGIPLVAAGVLRLTAWLKLKTLIARMLATIMLAPAVLSAGAIAIAEATGLATIADRPNLTCFRSENYASLSRLPAGVVAADIDYGPFLLALTPHSVLAAPYHRLSSGIVASHRALATPPEEARDVLDNSRASYLMICGPRPPEGLTEDARRQSLWGQLQARVVPSWLEPIPVSGPFAVYRVKPRT